MSIKELLQSIVGAADNISESNPTSTAAGWLAGKLAGAAIIVATETEQQLSTGPFDHSLAAAAPNKVNLQFNSSNGVCSCYLNNDANIHSARISYPIQTYIRPLQSYSAEAAATTTTTLLLMFLLHASDGAAR